MFDASANAPHLGTAMRMEAPYYGRFRRLEVVEDAVRETMKQSTPDRSVDRGRGLRKFLELADDRLQACEELRSEFRTALPYHEST